MTKTQKILLFIATIITLSIFAIMGYVIKSQNDILKSIELSSKEQKFLKDDITRIESTLLTKDDFDSKLNSIDMDISVIREDLQSVGGQIDAILQASAKTPGETKINQPSTNTIPIPDDEIPRDPNCPNCFTDKYGYFSNIQRLELSEPLSNNTRVPFGSVEFNATKENPWNYSITPRTYTSTVVIASDRNGNKRAYTKISITPDGSKPYSLPQVETKFFEKYPESSFFLWNPRAMVGLDTGYSTNNSMSANISGQVFISSYGRTKKDTDWYIGGIGLGYDAVSKNPNFVATPFSYKITSPSSVFQNINLGPSIGVDIKGNVYGLFGLRFGM